MSSLYSALLGPVYKVLLWSGATAECDARRKIWGYWPADREECMIQPKMPRLRE